MPRSLLIRRVLPVVALAIGACSADERTEPSTTGAIRVTLAYQGSNAQPGATVTLVDVDQTPTVTGNVYFFSGLTPDTYVAEVSGIPAGCVALGPQQDTLAVTVGVTADATFAIRCSGSDQLLVANGDGTMVALVNADGTGFRELPGIPLPYPIPLTSVSWSPDGQRLTFPYSPSASEERGIWTAYVDGSGLARLYPGNDTVPVTDARWAPDAAHLAISTYFFVNSYTHARHLHLVTTDGLNDVQLPQQTDLNPSYNAMDWSPNGDRLAVSARELDSMQNPDGSKLHIFLADGTEEPQIEVSGFAVRWSPTGDRIAYLDPNSLYTVRPDGTDVTPVRLSTNFAFDWAPDGSRLAVVADDGVRVVTWTGATMSSRASSQECRLARPGRLVAVGEQAGGGDDQSDRRWLERVSSRGYRHERRWKWCDRRHRRVAVSDRGLAPLSHHQSVRSAATGSRLAATRAGRYVASSTTAPSVIGTSTNVTGSLGESPYRSPASACATASAPRRPIPSPIAPSRAPSLMRRREHARRRGSQRHPHTDLARALGDAAGDHGIETH